MLFASPQQGIGTRSLERWWQPTHGLITDTAYSHIKQISGNIALVSERETNAQCLLNGQTGEQLLCYERATEAWLGNNSRLLALTINRIAITQGTMVQVHRLLDGEIQWQQTVEQTPFSLQLTSTGLLINSQKAVFYTPFKQ